MRTLRLAILFCTIVTIGFAQQSDFEIKERFKNMYDELKHDIDSVKTADQIALIPNRISGMETEFAPHKDLIGGAFYPETFESMMTRLKDQFALAETKATTIQTQGTRIGELESQVVVLNTELARLNSERDDLIAQLRTANNSVAQQQDLVRRLTANLQAKDKLVNAMIDSIFLPFGKSMDSLTEVQTDALGKKLEKTNIVTRIADIAQDNVKFLGATNLEPKDYSTLVNQYEQFRNRWNGLRERVNSAFAASNAKAVAKGKKDASAPADENPVNRVDASLAEWQNKLSSSVWAGVMKEFSSRTVAVHAFTDAPSFSASIRAYVDSAKAAGGDTKTFVDEIWAQRIDKDWKVTLEKDFLLGKAEYGSLDRKVSELHKEKFDWKILFWIVNAIVIALIVWWLFNRKSKKSKQQASPNPTV